MADNEIVQIDVAKYEEALNNLIGIDSAYFKGDKYVDALVECITLAKQFEETINRQKAEIERLQKRLNLAESCICDIEYAADKAGSNDRIDDAIDNYNNLVKEMTEERDNGN